MQTSEPFDLACCQAAARDQPAGAGTVGETADDLEERFRGPDLTAELLDLVRDRYWIRERWRWFADGERAALVRKGRGLLHRLRKDLASGLKILLGVRDDFLTASVIARFAAPRRAAILAGPVTEFFEPVHEVEDYLRFLEDLEGVRRASPSLISAAAASEALFQLNRGLLGHADYRSCRGCANLPVLRDAVDTLVAESGWWPRPGREVVPAPLKPRFAREFREYVEGLAGRRSLHRCAFEGASFPRVRALGQVLRAARASPSVTILLLGPMGTGKEALARLAHQASPRRSRGTFVPVNAGGLPEALADSALFGHERGAFTGAATPAQGAFRRADGGTLFLDEIGDLAPGIQVKLLRALQEGEVAPLGRSGAPDRVDVRVVAATNADLPRAVAEGRFREDLLGRLDREVVRVPALRRGDPDLPLLAGAILSRLHGGGAREVELTREALGVLRTRDWPGNVRELENVLERALNRARGDRIREGDIVVAANAGIAGTRVREAFVPGGVRSAGPPGGTGAGPRETGATLLPDPEFIRSWFAARPEARESTTFLTGVVHDFKRAILEAHAMDGPRRRPLGEVARLVGATQSSLTKFLGEDAIHRQGKRVFLRIGGCSESRPPDIGRALA